MCVYDCVWVRVCACVSVLNIWVCVYVRSCKHRIYEVLRVCVRVYAVLVCVCVCVRAQEIEYKLRILLRVCVSIMSIIHMIHDSPKQLYSYEMYILAMYSFCWILDHPYWKRRLYEDCRKQSWKHEQEQIQKYHSLYV